MVVWSTLAGCGDSSDSSGSAGLPWGEEAVEFFTAHAAALCGQDVPDIARFYAVDATVDYRGVSLGAFPGRLSEDRSSFLSYFDLCVSPERGLDVEVERVYLRPAGAVVVEQWTFPESATTAAMVSIVSVGDDGIESVRYLPGSSGSTTDASDRSAVVERLIAERFDPQQWETLATYISPDRTRGQDDVIVVVEDLRSSCAMRRAVHWVVAGEAIVGEQDHLDIESARSCLARAELGGGWWTGRDVPGPLDERPIAVLDIDGRPVTLFNSSPERERLAEWALGRFPALGLTAPTVERIVFEPSRYCDDLAGLARVAPEDVVVYMCVVDVCADPSCTDFSVVAKVSILHELAHAWLAEQEPDGVTKATIMDITETSTWDGAEYDWEDRGLEWSAETLAWGLLDEPAWLPRLGFPPCDVLETVFDLLTGSTPSGSCPA